MSYTLTLQCGCRVRVSRPFSSRSANTRIFERRGRSCRDPRHQVGVRMWLWDLLPEAPLFTDSYQRLMS